MGIKDHQIRVIWKLYCGGTVFIEIPSKCFLTSPSTRLPLVQATKTLVTINIFFAIELPASAKMPCLPFYNKKNEDYGEPDETMFTFIFVFYKCF